MNEGYINCELCFRGCVIPPGETGNCRVRYNRNGSLVSLVYGRPSAVHLDPIEKKPLYHFLPGSKVFSIGTMGCNSHCLYCQNWEISQLNPEDGGTENLPPEKVVAEASGAACRSVAFTYNEPSIFYEYVHDTCVLSKKKGFKNVLVTAGMLNEKPQRALMPLIDAASITLKGNDSFYEKIVTSKLKVVQNYIKVAIQEKVHVEIINLVVPTLNDGKDDLKWLISWVRNELGPDVPLHFLRFFPLYKLANLYPTPAETLIDAAHMAFDAGIRYVYVGNLPGSGFDDTKCPKCKDTVIERHGYLTPTVTLKNGKCPKCGERLAGVWE